MELFIILCFAVLTLIGLVLEHIKVSAMTEEEEIEYYKQREVQKAEALEEQRLHQLRDFQKALLRVSGEILALKILVKNRSLSRSVRMAEKLSGISQKIVSLREAVEKSSIGSVDIEKLLRELDKEHEIFKSLSLRQ
jgi:hypothetical protein